MTKTTTTRTVTNPGEDPKNDTDQTNTNTNTGTSTATDAGAGSPAPGADAFEASGSVAGDDGAPLTAVGKATAPGVSAEQFEKLMALVQSQQQQIASLTAAGNRAAQTVGKAEPLPDYHKTLASNPTAPVLTEKGWIVPEKWQVAVGKGS